MSFDLLKEYLVLALEGNVREADISNNERVPFGSKKHIADLEARLTSAKYWRDKQRKGTESRANYSRLVSRLQSELKSALRQASKP